MISIITSSVGVEPSIAFFLELLFSLEGIALNHTTKTPKELEKIRSKQDLLALLNCSNYAILIGNFFDNLVLSEEEREDVKIFKFSTGDKPLKEVLTFLKEKEYLTSKSEQLITCNLEAIDLIDRRITSTDNNSTQPFFTGLFNYKPELDNTISSLKEKFTDLFLKRTTVHDLQVLGNQILISQLTIVKDRVAKNSRTGFIGNKSYAITEAPEFVNLTHDELKRKYNPDITITISLKLSEIDEKSRIHYSMRSTTTNVEEIIVRNTSGGGLSHAAGGTREIDIMLDNFY